MRIKFTCIFLQLSKLQTLDLEMIGPVLNTCATFANQIHLYLSTADQAISTKLQTLDLGMIGPVLNTCATFAIT